MLWADTVAYWARWQRDRVAVRFGDRDVTWRQLNDTALALAAGMADLGVGRGDRVGLLMTNRPEFLEVVIACASLGAIVAPFNLRFTPRELAYVVGNADCAVVITEAALRDGLSIAHTEAPSCPIIDVDDDSFAGLHRSTALLPACRITPDDPLFICFTSGTTGDPKGAVLTHRSWFYASMARALQGGINRNDRILLPFPLAFTGGLALAMVAMWTGATLVLEAGFEPGRALALIESQRITVFMAVPTLFQQMALHPDFGTTDISSIRCASSGGATVPVALLRTYLDRGITMTQTYSLTEVSASGITLPYEESMTRVGSCGVPAMHSDARIVDADDVEVGPGIIGEIVIKGPEVMQGYWRNPEATAATLRDGWCHTGDLGMRDADGYFFVVDRAKDMIISGGLNVYPAEIERLLSGLSGVLELAVIGVADERWGETPAVIAVTDGSPLEAGDVLGRCVGVIADFKLPRYLVVRTEPLPRNMSGKVLKADLRQQYCSLADELAPIR